MNTLSVSDVRDVPHVTLATQYGMSTVSKGEVLEPKYKTKFSGGEGIGEAKGDLSYNTISSWYTENLL